MKYNLSILFLVLFYSFGIGQEMEWYSETNNNGVIIQNSFPKGGPYEGTTEGHFNESYLVFFTRVINKTEAPLDINLNFSGDPIQIPNSPDTFVQLFLPSEEMTLDKQPLFSYGIEDLKLMDAPTSFQSTIEPNEECLFYVAGIFYQTRFEALGQERGGNRAELVLKGNDLFYNMLPQVDSIPCGRIVFDQ
ncbi:hypothetical protein POV27_07420 [Aureisphaera galaxeae]|uniref:hypothetical protein n=1 Tax=Aureisphaera galaxeae TaxID=1538023 RepID=UPI002350D89E|nr:hypothetical protein [Aureisphaera galaxeae]MDC8003876.1 hypothetical protein [Aureisphaera galaxeae]